MAQESSYSLSVEEINRIISAAPTFRDRVLIEVLARTGMRRAELRDLLISDIDFDKNRLHIRSGKGDKARTVPINSKTLIDIKQLIGNRTKGNIFSSPKNYPNGLSLKQINEIVVKCAAKGGVKHPNPARNNVNPHLFRHSFTRNMLKAGMRIEYVQQILGHSSIKTTIDVYGTPSQVDVQEDYENKIDEVY